MRTRILSRPIILLLAAAALATGCGAMVAPVMPPMGGAYTEIQAPLDLNSQNGKQIGPKRGEASSVAILSLAAWGDAGIRAAAENGGITRVNHVDYRYKNVLFGVYAKYTTIVYGE